MSSISGECGIGTKNPAPLPETISAQDRFISAYPHVPVGAGKCGRQHQSHRHHQHRKLWQFWVDHHDWSAAGRSETGNPLRQNALDPGFHGVRMVRRMRTVMLMVPACPESHFLGRASRLRPACRCGCGSWKRLLDWGERAEGRDDIRRLRGPVLVSVLPADYVYVPHRHGGIVGFGFRAALSRGLVG